MMKTCYVGSVYDMPEGVENRLKFWLIVEEWTIGEAVQILAGINPEASGLLGIRGNFTLDCVEFFSGEQIPERDDNGFRICGCHQSDCFVCGDDNIQLEKYSKWCKDVSRLLAKPTENLTHASSKEWIERALSKGIVPDWLDWAIKHGLYTPKQKSAEFVPTTIDKPLLATERTTLLTIIAALCDYSAINHKERGAATQIAKMTEEIGAPVSDDAIREALKKISNAIESRMK